MEPEYPCEWSGLFDLQPGDYRLVLKRGPDPAMNLNFRSASDASESAMRDAGEKAVVVFSDEDVALEAGSVIAPGEQLSQIDLEGEELTYT